MVLKFVLNNKFWPNKPVCVQILDGSAMNVLKEVFHSYSLLFGT